MQVKGQYQVIDGFKCYNPELATINEGFSPDAFSYLRKVEESNFWFNVRNKVLINLIKKYSGSTKSKRFLEIGCGTGYVLSGLSSATDFDLMGSDIYVSGLKYANERLPEIEFVQMDATQMPFQNHFDAIGAFDVIEHISEDTLALENIYRSLKENGVLYLSVPQYMFMWSSIDDISYHKRRYSKDELIGKITDAGFQLEYCTSFVFTLFPLMMISRYLSQKRGKIVSGSEEFSSNRFLNKILELVLSVDARMIKSGIKLPFGGSLICVARKSPEVINK